MVRVWVFGVGERHVGGWFAGDGERDWVGDSGGQALGALWADVEDIEKEAGYAGHCNSVMWMVNGRVLKKLASS